LLSVLALIAPLALPGCKSSSEEAEAALGQLDTPLPHDPTDKFEIGPWWSDGKHLLNLRADGGYTIYSNNNRYSRALDRGRWGQQNYATMWLMPYGGNEPQRIRVAITRIDGRIALLPPRYGTMFAVAAPPTTMEDRLIGEWSGPMGGLMLNADSTYAFSPTIGAVDGEGRIPRGASRTLVARRRCHHAHSHHAERLQYRAQGAHASAHGARRRRAAGSANRSSRTSARWPGRRAVEGEVRRRVSDRMRARRAQFARRRSTP